MLEAPFLFMLAGVQYMQKNIGRIITLCNNIVKAEKLCLRDQVKNRAGRVIGKIPAEDNTVSMALFSFDKGEEISTTSRGRHKGDSTQG